MRLQSTTSIPKVNIQPINKTDKANTSFKGTVTIACEDAAKNTFFKAAIKGFVKLLEEGVGFFEFHDPIEPNPINLLRSQEYPGLDTYFKTLASSSDVGRQVEIRFKSVINGGFLEYLAENAIEKFGKGFEQQGVKLSFKA